MADEIQNVQEEAVETAQPHVELTNNVSTLLGDMVFGEAKPNAEVEQKEATEQTKETPQAAQTEQQSEEEILDENDYRNRWLKDKWGYDSEETFEKEFNELKQLKEKKPFEFSNDDSKKVAELINEGKTKELRQFLETQERLSDLTTAEVTKDTAEDIIKLGMQLKYKDLSPSEIQYKFNKEFGLPKEPAQGDLESDDEFAARKSDWQEKVNDIITNRVIEAKLLKPELSKFKTELVLPTIERQEQQPQQQVSQKDLDAFKALQDTFVQNVQKSINSFNGFSVQVKDKDVDYTVSYTPSTEEKSLIFNKVRQFTDAGFDANAIFAERWVEADGKTINEKQMQEDLFRLFGGSNAEKKLAVDAANKRLEAYLKEKKNVNIAPRTQGTFEPSMNNATEMDRLREAMLKL